MFLLGKKFNIKKIVHVINDKHVFLNKTTYNTKIKKFFLTKSI